MAKRDLRQMQQKLTEQYQKNKKLASYDLSLEELTDLTEYAMKDPVRAVILSFEAGIVTGCRARAKGRLPVL